jgi:lysophospholipase L1-like esterase
MKYKNTLLLIVIFFLILFFVELILHLFPISIWPSNHQTMDRYQLWKGIPFTTGETYVPSVNQYAGIKLNSHGFRSPEVSYEKNKDTFRIICMGDSSTFGMEVFEQDAYPAVLQKLLSEKYPNRKIQVVNAGSTGYSSFQGLMLLKHDILHFTTDYITIFYGICDSSTPHSRGNLTDMDYYNFNNSKVGKTREFLLHSKIYILIEKGIVYIAKKLKRFSSSDDKSEGLKRIVTRVPVNQTEEDFKEMIELIKKAGVKPIIINHYWLDNKGGISNTPYNQVMEKIGKEKDVIVINTEKVFSEAYARLSSDANYYFKMKALFPYSFSNEGTKSFLETFYIGVFQPKEKSDTLITDAEAPLHGKVHPTEFGHYLIAEALMNNIKVQ